MIGKTLKALIMVLLAVAMVLVASANRHRVTISLDPFSSDSPALTFAPPLYLVILLALISGVIVGGIATWLKQARWRRQARRRKAEVATLHAEIDRLRERVAAGEAALPLAGSMPAVARRAARRLDLAEPAVGAHAHRHGR
jgi:uncharacterized integral membrane protein